MRGPGAMAFKQGFLKNLLLSLQASASSRAAASVQERKRAIKSSAEIAMATARGGGARWPQAILASSSSRPPPSRLRPVKTAQRCRKIVRRCRHRRRGDDGVGVARTEMVSSREIARKLVRKRTKILRRMIPGGELLDEVSLLREAMDYVAHMHAQVEVLRRISKTVR
ncbi:hypothetical protein ACP70R_029720 [Stipagrostis hirtigluma subsp. patula]